MSDPTPPKSSVSEKDRSGWLIAGTVTGIVLVVGLAVWLAQSMYSRVVPTASFVTTTDMTPVDLYLESREGRRVRFRISKAYLVDPANWGGGRQDYVHVQAHAPSLRPYSVAAADPAQATSGQAPEQLKKMQLLLRITHLEFPRDYPSRRYERTLKEYNDRLPDAFGLQRYQKKVCPAFRYERGEKIQVDCAVHPEQVFMSAPGAAQGNAWIECRQVDRPGAAKCVGKMVYRGFEVEYLFPNSEIEHWRRFDTAAKALLDALFQQEEKPAQFK